MRKLPSNLGVAFVVLHVVLSSVGNADYPTRIEIGVEQRRIRIGEPLLIRVTFKFELPQFAPEPNRLLTAIGPEATVQIRKTGEEVLYSGHRLGPYDLYLQDEKGLEYSGNFILFYDHSKNKLIFDDPGVYTIVVRRTRRIISNPLNIEVEPPENSDRRVLSLLSDPDDYVFLEFGGHGDGEKRPERISHLSQVVEQYGNTLLAMWAAARLGLEYFQHFHEKHPSFEKFKSQYLQGQIQEPLFEQSYKYLRIGAGLPDEFPIRQETLLQLSRVEYMRDNLEEAISLINETAKKYPNSKYGRKAAKALKEELPNLMQREQPAPAFWTRRSLLIGAVAAIGVVVFLLLLRKKVTRRCK